MIQKLTNRKWKVLQSENILKIGPWLSVRQEHVQLPNGRVIDTWFTLEFPDWVSVIAVTKDGDMVMIDQYRHGIGETRYEIVAGVIDSGETPLQAAQRELLEETGFGGGEWREFMVLSPNTSNHNNRQYTFLATGVEKMHEQQQEPTEDIHVHVMKPDEVRAMAVNGDILQALHAAPLLKYFLTESPISC